MNLDDLSKWAEIVQSVATTLGIIAAGTWSFFVFVLGRSFAPNIRVQFKLQQVVDFENGKGAVISVTIKNIGKTRVLKESCYIATEFLSAKPKLPELSRLDSSLDFANAKTYRIFDEHTSLEPDEEATEDVLFTLGETPIFKMGVIFIDSHKKGWSSNTIIDTRIAEQK